ncbi:MAG: hypothetical protein WCJ45_02255 [bacterium]
MYDTFAVEQEKEIYEDNLKKLLKMNQDKQEKIGSIENVDERDEDEDEDDIDELYIMQAEILRELGQFNESIKILNKTTNDNGWKNQLLNACQEENQNIVKFGTEEIEEVNGLYRE